MHLNKATFAKASWKIVTLASKCSEQEKGSVVKQREDKNMWKNGIQSFKEMVQNKK